MRVKLPQLKQFKADELLDVKAFQDFVAPNTTTDRPPNEVVELNVADFAVDHLPLLAQGIDDFAASQGDAVAPRGPAFEGREDVCGKGHLAAVFVIATNCCHKSAGRMLYQGLSRSSSVAREGMPT